MKTLLGLLLLPLFVFVPACSDESPTTPVAPYQSLDGDKDNVLANLQKAYGERNLDEYKRLFATDFVSYFSAEDYGLGRVDVTQWDRGAELMAAENLFDANGTRPASAIQLQLIYAQGEGDWTRKTPPAGASAAGAEVYEKVVSYKLSIQTDDVVYITGQPIPSLFTVRRTNDEWQIVTWEDVYKKKDQQAAAGATEQMTWGATKYLWYNGPPLPDFRDPAAAKDNVLYNLEMAVSRRHMTGYDKLLDGSFVFHFSPNDVSDGNVSVAQWARASEMSAARNMFDPNFTPPNGSPVSSIDVTLSYAAGEGAWDPVAAPSSHPGETWYRKSLQYFLVVVAGETTWTSGNPKVATFTVRWDDAAGYWRIVVWRDEYLPPQPALLALATESLTWGNVKALYASER